MISSEVQRTLVKSAPELWAELSDPAALARHLGELGEIRITRIEPEQKVEWEADGGDTSGAVLIESSGWGTKVKLTVTRAGAAADEEAPADDPAPIITPQSDPASEPSAIVTPEPEPIVEPFAPAGERELPAVESAQPAEPEHFTEPEQVHEWEPEPDHIHESESLDDGTFTAEAERQTHDHDVHFDDQLHEPQLGAETELTSPPALELAPEPEPRRGFFARLFSRFRVEPDTGPEPSAPANQPDSAVDDYTIEDDEIDAASDFEYSEPEPLSAPATHQPTDAHEAWAAWTGPTPVATLHTEPELEAESPDQPDTIDERPQTAGEPPLDPFVASATVAVDEHLSETGFAAPDISPESAMPDISAEITEAEADDVAAENVETGEVEAVLTGVLDRLGAAHHRPFSRA